MDDLRKATKVGMIDRYRKAGGFVQLVILLESCTPAKRDKFLEIIRQEAPAWADVLPSKLIDIDRIYSWSDEIFAEIVGTLQDLSIAVAIHAGGPDLKTRIYSLMSQGRQRRIEDLLTLKAPSSGEIATMHSKIVETVRRMSIDGHLRFEKFDPSLVIEDEIEAALEKSGASSPVVIIEEGDTHRADEQVHEAAPSDSAELAFLRRKVTNLVRENTDLRKELNVARGKLEQIKKIA